METAWLIYLYIFIGNLGWVVAVFCVASVALIVTTVSVGFESWWGKKRYKDSQYSWDTDQPDNERLMTHSVFYNRIIRPTKVVAFFAVLFSVLASAYPSKSDLAYILGGTALVSVATSEEAQKLPDNILKAANVFLEGVADPTVTEGE